MKIIHKEKDRKPDYEVVINKIHFMNTGHDMDTKPYQYRSKEETVSTWLIAIILVILLLLGVMAVVSSTNQI